jgi:hypothetical protein
LAANRKLAVVYVLKDDLKHLWDFAVHGHALRFWEQWYSRTVRSRIDPLSRIRHLYCPKQSDEHRHQALHIILNS